MPLLYDLGLGLYHLGIRLAAPFVPKARARVRGAQETWQRLEAKSEALLGCIWMHCASVGEFEQGRPVLEELRRRHPDRPVLLTFYSPSGYAMRKDTPLATHVDYLPNDGAANARRFMHVVRPALVLWVRYEFWHHWLRSIHQHGTPLFLISGIFRRAQPFFRWYGGAHRAMLRCFTHVFVQDEPSRALLASIGIEAVTVSGDTRFDRVDAIARESERLPIGLAFHRAMDAPVLIGGSTWPADERLIAEALKAIAAPVRLVVVPHEPTPNALEEASRLLPGPVERWSRLESMLANDAPVTDPRMPEQDPFFARTLLVDRMGLLARLYQHADVAYVGGGFGDGIHSLLEAAAWGRPVIFGPRHQKFTEARGLIEAGGGFEVRDADELRAVLTRLITDRSARDAASVASLGYVREHVGATSRIIEAVDAALR